MRTISNFKFPISNFIDHPLFTGSFIMVFGSNAISFLNYLYHLLMGRMLGPEFYGELVALISLIGLFSIFPVSLSLVIVKYVSAAKNEKETAGLIKWLRSKGLIISFSIFILILIISPAIAIFLHIEKLSYLILIAVSFFLSIQVVINRSVLQGLLKFKETVLSIFAEIGFKFILSLVLIFLGYRVGGAMVALVVSIFIGWYMTNLYLRDRLEKNSTYSPDIKKMFVFSFPVLVQSFATTSIYTSDVILVKHFFSSFDAGIYAALSTLGKIIFFGASPIASVMFPLVSQRQSKGEGYRNIFIYSLLGTSILAAGVLIIYWLLPELAIKLLYGSAFLEAANLLVWFGIFMTLFTLSSLLINLNLSLGRTRVVVLPFIAAIIQITAIWFYHQNLFIIILLSISITALLLASLLIYSMFERKSSYEKKIFNGDKVNLGNSSSI